jgi:hypothetical protein
MQSQIPKWSKSCLPVVVLACLAAAAAAQEAPPDYGRFREGVFLRYLNAEEGELREVPRIGLSFGDRPIRAVLDSGSTGIVVASSLIPNFDSLASVGEGKLTYSSSGRVMRGQWVVTPVALVGRDGAAVQTEPMPVLAVTHVECLQRARDCAPSDAPHNIAMVGIGYGREGDMQSQSTPDKNPLLRVTASSGDRRRGYVLTAHGVHVGLTGANTRGEFSFTKLSRQPDRPDWSATPACISLNGQAPPACGTMLVDTGVSVMFMTVPAAQAGNASTSLAAGTDVSIRVGTAEKSSELYRFIVDGGSALAPDRIHLRVSPGRVFVNTSFHLLNGFDVLYDADGGYAGFRRRDTGAPR